MCSCVFANEESRAFYIQLGFFTLGVETQPLASLKLKKPWIAMFFCVLHRIYCTKKVFHTGGSHVTPTPSGITYGKFFEERLQPAPFYIRFSMKSQVAFARIQEAALSDNFLDMFGALPSQHLVQASQGLLLADERPTFFDFLWRIDL